MAPSEVLTLGRPGAAAGEPLPDRADYHQGQHLRGGTTISEGGGWGSRCADAIGQMVRDACVPWRAEPATSASPAGPGGLHCGRATGSAESKQAEGGRDARVWLPACAHAVCVGGWRAVQVVQVARCGAARCAHPWSQQASLDVDATGSEELLPVNSGILPLFHSSGRW